MENIAENTNFDGANLIIEEAGASASCDATFLISTLLVFVAKGDGAISELETDKMLDILSSHSETGSATALQHLSSAVMTLANDKDIALKLRKIGQGLVQGGQALLVFALRQMRFVDEPIRCRKRFKPGQQFIEKKRCQDHLVLHLFSLNIFL